MNTIIIVSTLLLTKVSMLLILPLISIDNISSINTIIHPSIININTAATVLILANTVSTPWSDPSINTTCNDDNLPHINSTPILERISEGEPQPALLLYIQGYKLCGHLATSPSHHQQTLRAGPAGVAEPSLLQGHLPTPCRSHLHPALRGQGQAAAAVTLGLHY